MNSFFLPGNFPGLPSNLVSHWQQNWANDFIPQFLFLLFLSLAASVGSSGSDFFNEMMAGLFFTS